MEIFSFHTIEAPAVGSYRESGSKFLSFAYPVSSENEIRDNLEALKKKFYDAHHHCYAWMLGPDKGRYRAFDDGEPNHSAGDPILGQIKSRNLTDVLVVVVRYFGGVKLGVGGLIQAYRTAAEEALNNAAVVEREITHAITIRYSYEATTEVMRLVKDFELIIVRQEFLEECVLYAEVKRKYVESFKSKAALLISLGHTFSIA